MQTTLSPPPPPTSAPYEHAQAPTSSTLHQVQQMHSRSTMSSPYHTDAYNNSNSSNVQQPQQQHQPPIQKQPQIRLQSPLPAADSVTYPYHHHHQQQQLPSQTLSSSLQQQQQQNLYNQQDSQPQRNNKSLLYAKQPPTAFSESPAAQQNSYKINQAPASVPAGPSYASHVHAAPIQPTGYQQAQQQPLPPSIRSFQPPSSSSSSSGPMVPAFAPPGIQAAPATVSGSMQTIPAASGPMRAAAPTSGPIRPGVFYSPPALQQQLQSPYQEGPVAAGLSQQSSTPANVSNYPFPPVGPAGGFCGPYSSSGGPGQAAVAKPLEAQQRSFQHLPGQQFQQARQQQAFEDKGPLGASPDFVRYTVGKVPHSTSLLQKSHLPLGIILRPLAQSSVPVYDVHFRPNGKVVRCHRCRTYINLFCGWDSSGRRWTCNMCNYNNEAPQSYSPVTAAAAGVPDETTGARSAEFQQERPELCNGSIEFIAPGDYMVRPPQPPSYLFLIDVSLPSVVSGLLSVVCQAIKTAILSGQIPGGSRTLIGIMTFDSAVHFYKLESESGRASLVVVPNLSDVFVPFPNDGALVNLEECSNALVNLLDALPHMWASQRFSDSGAGTAIKAALSAMKTWGGKLSVFMSTAPSVGDLFGLRDLSKVQMHNLTGDRETDLLKPASEDVKLLAGVLTQSQISVDLYLCTPSSLPTAPHAPSASGAGAVAASPVVDVSTLSQIAQFTAGEFRYYPGFNAAGGADKLKNELIHSITRQCGWEAVMRYRVSRGWRISSWFGHFCLRHNDLLVVPNCHSDQTFGIFIEIEENIAPEPFFYFQSALLYTNCNGERRIRVHTLGLPVTQSLSELLSSIDTPILGVALGYQAIDLAQKKTLSDSRQYLQSACSKILISSAQSNVPYPPKLTLYVLGLLKSMAFREGKDATPDLRNFHWVRFTSAPVETLFSYFYPKLISLHNMNDRCGTVDQNQNVVLPSPMSLSAAEMSQSGIYLLSDGECMMLWVGKSADPSWLMCVFGTDNIDFVNPVHGEVLLSAPSGPDLRRRVAAVVQEIRHSQMPFMKLLIVKQGTPLEHKFFCSLIEDRSHACMLSHSEFLLKIGVRPNTSGGVSSFSSVPAAVAHHATPTTSYAAPTGQQQMPSYPHLQHQQYGSAAVAGSDLYTQQQQQQHQQAMYQQPQPQQHTYEQLPMEYQKAGPAAGVPGAAAGVPTAGTMNPLQQLQQQQSSSAAVNQQQQMYPPPQ